MVGVGSEDKPSMSSPLDFEKEKKNYMYQTIIIVKKNLRGL
jgi:hypothetical protein